MDIFVHKTNMTPL